MRGAPTPGTGETPMLRWHRMGHPMPGVTEALPYSIIVNYILIFSTKGLTVRVPVSHTAHEFHYYDYENENKILQRLHAY
jgi:hypothetical protein